MSRVFIKDFASCVVVQEMESVEEACDYFGVDAPEQAEWFQESQDVKAVELVGIGMILVVG